MNNVSFVGDFYFGDRIVGFVGGLVMVVREIQELCDVEPDKRD
jgi:hypothetical protein